jgi:hypothetical protein|nr:MAG TPA: hypothetical protein [Inoviridae sp.]
MMKKRYLLLLIPFLFIGKVKAAMVGDYSFLGHKLDDEFVVLSSSPLTGSIYFYNTIESNSTSSANFFYVDLCTNGAEPTLWITSNSLGAMAPSTKWYKVNQSCKVNGESARVYRQIIFISSSYQWGTCAVDGVSVKCSENSSSASLFSNTYYNVYMRILHMGITEDIPLNDLILDEQTTQTSILNDILSSIKSDSSMNQQIKENIEKQLEEQKKQLEEQKKTNETLKDDNIDKAQDSAGGFFNDFTTDTHGLTAIITAPLSLISNITSSSCSPLVLPLPYVDKDLTLPCMRDIYSSFFGSFLSIYQVITFGVVAYWVCVRIFNLVKDFKNPDHDEIEVLDL